MKTKKHPIGDYMTRSPHTIRFDVPLAVAQQIMREKDIRHLPVVKDENLVGLLSERNVKAALVSPGGEKFLVEDVMMPDAFVVSESTDLSQVLDEMAQERYGSAIIRDEQGNVTGIFTTVDACRYLSDFLKGETRGS
jgi:predicted transcriptional regulator